MQLSEAMRDRSAMRTQLAQVGELPAWLTPCCSWHAGSNSAALATCRLCAWASNRLPLMPLALPEMHSLQWAEARPVLTT